ncbi:MAG: PDZ domain-containing protein [Planctomycetia bacterium]|nr:PDZ domain-containing protein [Planctomycetia bacterium]
MRIIAVLLVAGPWAWVAAEDSPRSETDAKAETRSAIAAEIARLGDARFEVRETAMQQLGRAGIEAVEPLLAAAQGENLEVTWRATRALGRLIDTDDAARFAAAERALERLEASGHRAAARRAVAALETQPEKRWRFALARFEALGGWAAPRRDDEQGTPVPTPPPPIILPQYFVVPPDWKGGAAGLANIRRMDSALQTLLPLDRKLGIYVIDGADVAPQAVDETQNSLRFMEFASRGRARLGVSFLFDVRGRGLEVRDIERDAADATKDALKRGDLVIKYDGETLTDFDHLTRITRRHDVGDKLRVEVRRNGEPVESEIELTGWKKPEISPKGK